MGTLNSTGALEAVVYIDPNVEHVGVSKLRKLNSKELRLIKKVMVLQDNDEPLAVLVKYEQFLIMQNQLKSLLETIELLSNQEEVKSLIAGLNDMQNGKTRKLSDIKASLRKSR